MEGFGASCGECGIEPKFCEDIQSSFRGNDNLDTLVKFQQTLSLLLNETPNICETRCASIKVEMEGKRHGAMDCYAEF